VLDSADDFESHIKDTLSTGSHLGDEKAVRFMVENAPDAIASLEEIGVLFTQEDGQYHLTTEGGHSNRRVVHVADKTGQSIQTSLLDSIKSKKNIHLFENFIAIDLLKKNKQCYGAYILNKANNEVESFIAHQTIIATFISESIALATISRVASSACWSYLCINVAPFGKMSFAPSPRKASEIKNEWCLYSE
jgi:L-aspartate oxidase